MKYRIVSTDGRVVAKHKKFERCYVQHEPIYDEDLEVFETEDLDYAMSWLEATRSHWGDSFMIITKDE